ncbi:MAG: glucosaminidase domain-containing protein [Azospirillaceae bacterium]|nr:glucosaminidase domain-containing protein [Azospirillaceae bacterium]
MTASPVPENFPAGSPVLDTFACAAAWRDRQRRGLSLQPAITAEGLILGAGTLLAKHTAAAWAPSALEADAECLLALLAIAYRRPFEGVEASRVLVKVHAAGRALAAGEPVRAAIHLAHAGLGPLPDANAALCLFLAETLLDEGMAPDALMKLATSKDETIFVKSNPNHRPAGPGGGQFYSPTDGGGQADQSEKKRDSNMSAEDPVTQKKRQFVQRNIAIAREVAGKLNVPVENILGVAAIESGWGGKNEDARFTREGNNYFVQHAHSKYENGTMFNHAGNVEMSTFATPEDSFRSFAESEKNLIGGVRDPEKFAQRLQNSKRFGIYENGEPVPNYVGDVAGTAKKLRAFITEKMGG